MWSRPIRCRIVACRSETWQRSSTASKPSSSVAPIAWPPLTPAPASHMREAVRVVVAARLADAFAGRRAAELAAPDEQRLVPQAGALQVGRSARRSAGRSRRRAACGWRCSRCGRPRCLRGGRRRSRAGRSARPVSSSRRVIRHLRPKSAVRLSFRPYISRVCGVFAVEVDDLGGGRSACGRPARTTGCARPVRSRRAGAAACCSLSCLSRSRRWRCVAVADAGGRGQVEQRRCPGCGTACPGRRPACSPPSSSRRCRSARRAGRSSRRSSAGSRSACPGRSSATSPGSACR